MVELIRGNLDDVFKDEDINEIIETELKLVRVRRKDVEARKQFIKELIDELKKEKWIDKLAICPDYDPDCSCGDIIINIISDRIRSVDDILKLERRTLKILDSIVSKYGYYINDSIHLVVTTERIHGYGAEKCYVVFERKEHNGTIKHK